MGESKQTTAVRRKKKQCAAIINSGDTKPKHGNTVKHIRGILAVGAAANLGPHLGAVSFT